MGSKFRDKEYAAPTGYVTDIVLSGRFANYRSLWKAFTGWSGNSRKIDWIFDLSELASRPFNILSSGEQQKTLLARALMPNPDLLVLDEPAQGLILARGKNCLTQCRECASFQADHLYFCHSSYRGVSTRVSHASGASGRKDRGAGSQRKSWQKKCSPETFDLKIEVHGEAGGCGWWYCDLFNDIEKVQCSSRKRIYVYQDNI